MRKTSYELGLVFENSHFIHVKVWNSFEFWKSKEKKFENALNILNLILLENSQIYQIFNIFGFFLGIKYFNIFVNCCKNNQSKMFKIKRVINFSNHLKNLNIWILKMAPRTPWSGPRTRAQGSFPDFATSIVSHDLGNHLRWNKHENWLFWSHEHDGTIWFHLF